MKQWVEVAAVDQFPKDAGACVKIGDKQIAVFNFDRTEWYAVQNQCPHKRQMVLSRGLIGDSRGEPKVVCPLHKNQFSLATGRHLGGNPAYQLQTYPVRVEAGMVKIEIE